MGSAVGTAVGVGVTGGFSAFVGGAACAAGSGADYYDCYGLAAAGAGVHGASYAAGTGINAVNQARNTVPRNTKSLVGPGHRNPTGFTYTSDLAPDDPRIVQQQNAVNDYYAYNNTSIREQNLLGKCEGCTRAMAQNGGTTVIITPPKNHNVAVDGREVGFPHRILIKDDLVWDAPTNTWGQNVNEYFKRLSFPELPDWYNGLFK